jgi:hypothetical protein
MIDRGTTLGRFALQHGLSRSTVYAAARGMRRGVASRRVMALLSDYLSN